MLLFSTELPLAKGTTSTDFLNVVREWILASPHTNLTEPDLEPMREPKDWSLERADLTLRVLTDQLQPPQAVAARYTQKDGMLDWVTTLVYSTSDDKGWVSIRTSCEADQPQPRLPAAKKPVVVRHLLDKLGGGQDGELDVRATPHRLSASDVDLAANLMLGASGCHLPVVYVSCPFPNQSEIDSDSLAHWLCGMAHVVVEPSRQFSRDIQIVTDSANAYGGALGVYWPEGRGRQLYLRREGETDAELLRNLTDMVRKALLHRRPMEALSWSSLLAASSRATVERLYGSGSQSVDAYIRAFDDELRGLRDQLQEAEREIMRLKGGDGDSAPSPGTIALKLGKEQDFFAGESRCVVLEALSDSLRSLKEGSRRFHLLKSIVDANKNSTDLQQRRDKVKALLRDYRRIDKSVSQGLRDLGFTISLDGKHPKLYYFADSRYQYTIPSTSSDHRAGLNTANMLARGVF